MSTEYIAETQRSIKCDLRRRLSKFHDVSSDVDRAARRRRPRLHDDRQLGAVRRGRRRSHRVPGTPERLPQSGGTQGVSTSFERILRHRRTT